MTASNSPTTTQLTVTASDANSGIIAEVIASLPVSYAWSALTATGDAADVHEISGTNGWTDRVLAALEAHPRAVLVTDPVAADPDELVELATAADEAGVHVVLAEQFAGNPTVTALIEVHPTPLADLSAVFVDVVANRVDVDLQLTQLRTLRAFGATTSTPTHTIGAGGVTLAGTTGSTLLGGIGARSHALPQTVKVRGYSAEQTLELDLPDAATARPASAVLTDADGSRVLPTIYENAYRATWRALHATLQRAGVPVNDTLRGFADDVRTIQQ